MSDFLESLVLRAAGLPVTAVAPRMDRGVAGDEAESVEEIEETAGETPSAARPVAAAPRDAARAVPAEAERPAIEREVIREERREQQLLREPHEVVERPVLIEPQAAAPPPPGPVVEHETTILERQPAPAAAPAEERVSEPPRLVAQPAPKPLEIARETLVEHETTRIEPRPQPEPPVILQPIVVDQTRTIIEPPREERTIVETRTERIRDEHTVETEPETATPQTIVEPRVVERHHHHHVAEGAKGDEPIAPRPAIHAHPEREAQPPLALVLPTPPPPSQPPPETPEEPPREVAIHIGTIEIRAAAPPPPPAPAPAPVIVPRTPEPAANFDDYAAVRNYIFPDVWR